MSRVSEMRSLTPNTSPIHEESEKGGLDSSLKTRESFVRIPDRLTNDIEGDMLFQADYEMNWTISDQQRLLAIDRLQTRTLEYHNNVHQRVKNLVPQSTAESGDIVAQILVCQSNSKVNERPFIATKSKVTLLRL